MLYMLCMYVEYINYIRYIYIYIFIYIFVCVLVCVLRIYKFRDDISDACNFQQRLLFAHCIKDRYNNRIEISTHGELFLNI